MAHLEKVHVINALLSAVLHSVVYLLLDSDKPDSRLLCTIIVPVGLHWIPIKVTMVK